MASYKHRMTGYIREGLIKTQEARMKAMGNPYAYIGAEPDHKALNVDADIIFTHLVLMGVLKNEE